MASREGKAAAKLEFNANETLDDDKYNEPLEGEDPADLVPKVSRSKRGAGSSMTSSK
jgi:hypothetical protein